MRTERSVKKATREIREDIDKHAKNDPVAQVNLIQKRCESLLFDQKRWARDLSKSKKRADQLQKEKDAARSELSKTNTQRHKLEGLCRELQKEGKLIKADNKRLKDSEQHDRKLLSESLEGMMTTIEDVVAQREQPNSHGLDIETDEMSVVHYVVICPTLGAMNIGIDKLTVAIHRFRSRFKGFCEQYELRELAFNNAMRGRESDLQYQALQCSRAQAQARDEATHATNLRQQVDSFTHTETELRSQLNIYVEKFKQVSPFLYTPRPFLSLRDTDFCYIHGSRLKKPLTTPTTCS